ncbi:hypothetical protein B0O99DRAFT_37686 [Bisporella sp. PMI_857]|nr:hypothetical protein B0O99DRAFT_37686 [Bisporella sp. PMI_857]
MFEKFELPLPDPWIQVSPFRGRNQFKRLYAGPPTTLDPRLRAIPPAAVFNPAAIRTKGYMQAYNAHPSSCTQYWGHQGRQQRSTSLTIPTVLRVGFIGLATLLYLNGYRCILSYPVIYGVDFGGSDEDRRRLDRIAYWKIFLLASMVPQMIFIVMHASGSAGSMLMLWLKCHLKYVEIENQDRHGTFDDYARGAVPSVGQRSNRGESPSGSG